MNALRATTTTATKKLTEIVFAGIQLIELNYIYTGYRLLNTEKNNLKWWTLKKNATKKSYVNFNGYVAFDVHTRWSLENKISVRERKRKIEKTRRRHLRHKNRLQFHHKIVLLYSQPCDYSHDHQQQCLACTLAGTSQCLSKHQITSKMSFSKSKIPTKLFLFLSVNSH